MTNKYDAAFKNTDIRDPFIFSVINLEDDFITKEIMSVFFPELRNVKNFRKMYDIANLLHGIRNNPSITATGELDGEEITMTLDYIADLTDTAQKYAVPGNKQKGRKFYNVTLSRNDPFACGHAVDYVRMTAPGAEDPVFIYGCLVSLHETASDDDPARQEVINMFRTGTPTGMLSCKIDALAYMVKNTQKWACLYAEEHAYQDYMNDPTRI